MTHWQPTARLTVLEQRAQLLAAIRRFFSSSALEIEVPCIGNAGVTDLHIDNIQATVNGASALLQSSPEYFLKRLLAAGSGDLYYLGKAFRDNETGAKHNPEFTLLEWYRLGWTEQQLIDEVIALISEVSTKPLTINRFHYGDIFEQLIGINPHSADVSHLQQLAGDCAGRDFQGESTATCLDLLFSLQVEPQLPPGLTLIDHYPACQSALAKLATDAQGNTIALRFEAFLNGMELANGYSELTDTDELLARFRQDQALRQQANKPIPAIDEKFIAAMTHGLPQCSGVALGVDRLLMYIADTDQINDVLAFPFATT